MGVRSPLPRTSAGAGMLRECRRRAHAAVFIQRESGHAAAAIVRHHQGLSGLVHHQVGRDGTTSGRLI